MNMNSKMTANFTIRLLSLITVSLVSLLITVNAMAAPVSTWNFSEGAGPIAADSSGSNTAKLGHEDFNNGFTGSLWSPAAYLVTTATTDTTQPVDITDSGGRVYVTATSGTIELYAGTTGTASSTDIYNWAQIAQAGSPAFLSGDFDIKIDYTRIDNNKTVYYAVPLRFIVNIPTTPTASYMYAEIYTQSSTAYVRGVAKATSAAAATAGTVYSNPPSAGMLRVKRAGSTWTMYYHNGTSWVTLHSVTGAATNAGSSIGITSYMNRRFSTGWAFTTRVDNFQVYTSPSWTTGHPDLGNAVLFDGVDDYINIPYNPSLNPAGVLSIEAFVNPTAAGLTGARQIVESSNWTTGYRLGLVNGNLRGIIKGTVLDSSGATMVADTWYHVALTWDGSTLSLWQNGSLLTSTAAAGPISTTGATTIGSYAGTNLEFFGGSIDKVAIYNNALDATTIAQNADAINIPQAVTDLIANYAGGNFTLNWTTPASGSKPITGYEIYYSNDAFATAGTLVADSDGNAANNTATVSVPLSPQLSFKIRAVNSVATGPDSNIVTKTMIPDAVGDLIASYNGSIFQLSWTAPNDNGPAITSYEIYYSSDGFATAGSLISDTDGNAADATATVSGITLTPQLSFRIKAVNGAGAGPDSNIATVVLAPSAITDLTASYNSGSSSFLLNWTAPNDNGSAITGYQIYYSSDGFSTAGNLLTDTDGNATDATANITGLALTDSMSFRVNAVNIAGAGPNSNTAIITFARPNAITTLNVVPGYADGQATLTWTAPADNGEPITDYVIEYDAGSGWQTFNDGVSTTTGAVVTGLSNAVPGKAVYFRVTTVNQYLTSLSNVAYGFPFLSENVVWVFDDNTYTTGGLSGGQVAESTKSIFISPAQDFGVEAVVQVGTATLCWYGSGCTAYYPSYVGLSPPDYDQTVPKYAIRSRDSTSLRKYIHVDGVQVMTVVTTSNTSPVRVEKVGNNINFVIDNVVRHSVDISAETFTELVADGYAPGSVSSAKIYGAGLHAPTTVTGLKASPGYGNVDGDVSLTWTAAYDNNDPITDYLVEYDTGSGWQPFPHAAITIPGITVTGLDNTVPGLALQFRVAAVNGSGTGAYSNQVHGFPFPAESVVWWYDNTESSKVIEKDGGVEANIIPYSHYPSGCWYTSCEITDPSYVGLSPPHYNQSIPKYSINSVAVSGLVRVERVGDKIYFVKNNVVYSSVNVDPADTNLVADKYEPIAGLVTSSKIYGAHTQPPADILDLIAKPAVGWQQVGLEWTIPPANNASITDFKVEYSIDNDTGPWFSIIVPNAGGTTGTATVSGLDGGVPGRADFFRVSAINAQGTSNPSNIVHGFPFIKPAVIWSNRVGTTDAGGGVLTGNGTADSFSFIEQDGGIEAQVNGGGSYPGGCWYSSCWIDTYAYAGLSPRNYGGTMPKYAFASTGNGGSFKAIYYKGSFIKTVNIGGSANLVRVERVGSFIHYVANDVVVYSADITAENDGNLFADAAVTGQNSNVVATIFGAQNPPVASGFNAVEPSTHNHDPASNDPITGRIHVKIVGDEIALNIVALKDVDLDGISDAVETAFSSAVNRRVQVQLGTLVNPGLPCTAVGNFQPWTPQTDVYNDTTLVYDAVNWGTTGIRMTFQAADPGQKVLKIKIRGQANQNIRLFMTDLDIPTSTGCSSDSFTLRPNNYTLFVGHNVATGVAAPGDNFGDNPLNNFTTGGSTEIHKSGTPVRLRIRAFDMCHASTPSCSSAPVQNFIHNMQLAPTIKGHADMSDTAGVFSSTLLNLYDRDAVNPIQFVPADGGVTTIDDASYDEVGIITISIANDPDYAAGDRDYVDPVDGSIGDGSNDADLEIAGATLNVGRFVPDHLAFNANNAMVVKVLEGIGTAITPFTYIGQPFNVKIDNVDIDAQNAGNTRTVNYTGAFWKLGDVSDTSTDASGALDRNSNPINLSGAGLAHNPSTATGANGTVRTNYNAAQFTYNRPAVSVGAAPFTPLINLTISGIQDTDGIALAGGINQTVAITSTGQQRFGRVNMTANECSGTDRRINVIMESLPASGGWIENTDDNCGGNCPPDTITEIPVTNSFDLDNVTMDNGTITQNAGTNPTIAINGGTTTASISAWGDSDNEIIFTLPASAGSTVLTVTPDLTPGGTDNLPWLADSNVSATADFSCAPGSKNIMYQRESLR